MLVLVLAPIISSQGEEREIVGTYLVINVSLGTLCSSSLLSFSPLQPITEAKMEDGPFSYYYVKVHARLSLAVLRSLSALGEATDFFFCRIPNSGALA